MWSITHRQHRYGKVLIGLLLFGATLALIRPVQATPPLLQPGPDGRHLVDPDGHAVLISGDSAWSLMAQPTLAEAKLYLDDRATLGFNFLVVNLIEHHFADNAPANADGEPPFTGTPFVTPNEAYFAHVDSVLDYAASKDIQLLLSPVYLGWECGNEGWCGEIQAASLADMREWGRYLGARYEARDNLLWCVGGDTDPTPVLDKLREFVAGLQEYDSRHLITAHNQRGTQSLTYWPNESWLGFNSLIVFPTALYQATSGAYAVTPPMPFLMLEGLYENYNAPSEQALRAQSYWSVLTGAAGVVFGNCPLWHFGSSYVPCSRIDWQNQLSSTGSVQMGYYRELFESRHWAELVPDVDNLVLTAGQGTDGSEDYVLAAAAADGSSILAYVPSPRALNFDTSVLTGDSVRVWWYDPTDGSATLEGDFAGGMLNLPSGPSGDRVLVLDDKDRRFAAPGTPLPTSTDAPAASGLRLDQNRPNPFNPRTEIRFGLDRAQNVRLEIFDAQGHRLRVLVDGRLEAGSHWRTWDGADDRGAALASGIYYYRLWTREGVRQRKMVLLR